MEYYMKKILTTLALFASITTVASADLIRTEIGAGMWMQTPSTADSTFTSSETEDAQPYVWALIKHPVPIVPNLRVEYVNVKNTSLPVLGLSTDITYTQIDLVPYYNILDNTFWITLDLGLDIKSISAKKEESTQSTTDSMLLPLGYVRARVQVPLSGFGAEADVKYISYDNNTVYDARAKVDYTFDISPVIQPGIEIGYRMQHFETKELFGAKMNMDFAGVYAGVMLRF
jgi:outer membrane protein